MDAKRYTIRRPTLSATTATTISLSLDQNINFVGQQELIDTKFVDVEVSKSINETFDYEVTRFTPLLDNSDECENIVYKINILDNNVYNLNTKWSNIGFEFEDFSLNKNSFNKTFLRLDFYDNDIGTTQRLLFFKTIFPSLKPEQQPNSIVSQLPQPNNVKLNFKVGNILKNEFISSEGYYLYYFKDEVIPTVPKELYMKATLFNAKTGKITGMMSSDNPNVTIDELAKTNNGFTGKLHTKYLLIRYVDGYRYKIDNTYSTNITNNTTEYIVDLYQISVS